METTASPAARGAGASGQHPPLEAEFAIVSNTAEFAALEEQWDELYDDCPRVTPFQSWAWLYSWWEAYGDEYLLKLVTIRRVEDSLLVGIIPIMSERKSPWRVLFIGTGLSDYLDVLVREGFEEEAAKAGCEAVAGLCRFGVADLQQLRPRAAAWEVFGRWGGFEARIWQESCPVVELKPWEELVASLNKRGRNNVRRTIKRVEEDGVSRDLVGVERAEEAASTLVALHREEWEGREINTEHLSERFESCLRAAARRMTVRGIATIVELRRDDEVIVADLMLFDRSAIRAYIGGAKQEAFRRYQVTALCLWNAAHIAPATNATHLDWLRGEEEYKLQWNPELLHSDRLILGRAPLPWGAYAAYHALRSNLRAHLHSGKAPKWIEDLVERAKKIRAS